MRTRSRGASEMFLHIPDDLVPIEEEVYWTMVAEEKARRGNIPTLFRCKYCNRLFWSGSDTLIGPTAPKYCSLKCYEQCCGEKQREKNFYSRYSIFERDGFQCIYCGKTTYKDRKHMQLDHIVPLVAGGKGIAGNLATTCKHCNISKNGNRLPSEIEFEILSEIKRRNEASGIPQNRRIGGTSNPGGEYAPRKLEQKGGKL